MTQATLLIEHAAELVTVAGPPGPRRGPAQAELGLVPDGAVAIGADGRIVAVGSTVDLRAHLTLAPQAQVIDASGCTVMPGFVDPHTHAIFGGDRLADLSRRLHHQSASHLGGGIMLSVSATRCATSAELETRARGFLTEMLRQGTTSVEVKSGYALTVEGELRLLRVAARLAGPGLPRVLPTFLGAHAVPPELADRPDEYVLEVIDEMLPRVAAERLARFCDAACEPGLFTVEHCRRILEAGRAHGLALKLHAEQTALTGGARLAVELGAVSVDHLEYLDNDGIAALTASQTVAVIAPGATLMLLSDKQPPARRLIDQGVPVALTTDFNPGSSPILAMPIVIGLACLRAQLQPSEAVAAATLNAAHAVGLGDELGSLEPGKWGDVVILDAPSHAYLVYWFGRNLVRCVVRAGQIEYARGEAM